MTFPPAIWQQIKNTSADKLIRALEKDGWMEEPTIGAIRPFVKGDRRVTIHFHPGKTYGPKTLKNLLDDIGWSEEDLGRLKLVKKKKSRKARD